MFGIEFIKGVGGDKGDELTEGVEAGVEGSNGGCFVFRVASVKRYVNVVSTDFECYGKFEPSDAASVGES